MKCIVCGPLGAQIGMLIGYTISFLLFPGETELDQIARLSGQPYCIAIGVTVCTCIPAFALLGQDVWKAAAKEK